MNLLLAIIYLVLTFGTTLLAYKFYGRTGLYIWICISIILANIQAVKLIEVFGFTTVLGNIAYANVFLATDILNEKYGANIAKKSVIFGFLAMISFTVLMVIALIFTPSEFDDTQTSLVKIFSLVPRITIASLIAYLVSQLFDVFAYQKLKTKFNKLWLSNNGSTMVSQIIDTILFITIGYAGLIPFEELLTIAITMYVIKFAILSSDTFFIYVAQKISPHEE
jgi:queuosine precursor transporter